MVIGPAVFTKMKWDTLQAQANDRFLNILGAFHPNADDTAPEGTRTLVLLGPLEPKFWDHLRASEEWADGVDPVDRWSNRVITGWAKQLGAHALFPFGGPPYQPFYTWALRTGRIHASPINFLVHDQAGLFVSFRGALALPDRLNIPPAPPAPCGTCLDQPCVNACPVHAFDNDAYNVGACKAYLDSEQGHGCMTQGCAARRSCPISQTWGRPAAQSAYHMRIFKG